MKTYNDINDNQEERAQDNQSFVAQYDGQHFKDENNVIAEENLDEEFLNAIDRDDFENDFDESQFQEEDPKKEEDELSEAEIEEPETFADDGYKID